MERQAATQMSQPRRIPPKRRRGKFDEERERRMEAMASGNGLGDWVAWGLANGYIVPFVRLTPLKWREIKVACNFADACNCGERKIALNKFGRWIVKPFRRAAARVKRWWKALPPAPPAE
jgi:hypothetical protein